MGPGLNNWKVIPAPATELITDPATRVAGAVMVWGGGGYGHVAVVRGYGQDASGNVTTVLIDEQNYGKFIIDPSTGKRVTDPITDHFGIVPTSPKSLPISDLDRPPLNFRGADLASRTSDRQYGQRKGDRPPWRGPEPAAARPSSGCGPPGRNAIMRR